MQKIVIAGGSGTLGRALAGHLAAQSNEVLILTRALKPDLEHRQVIWNGKDIDPSWARELEGCVLINLAGELVDRPPTDANFELLRSSRTQPTLALAEAAKHFGKPSLWLQMSTLAIYGDSGNQTLSENSMAAYSPRQMTEVARSWEAAVTADCADRLVYLRAAVVLQPHSPALKRLITVTRWFMGGTVGSGRQWVSWIHIIDFLRALDFVAATPTLAGPVHITAPAPITNRNMMAMLRKQLHRPPMPPTPRWAIKLGSRLIFNTDAALALTGRRALPTKLEALGFSFEFENFGDALAELLASD